METAEHLPTQSDSLLELSDGGSGSAGSAPSIWRSHPAPRKAASYVRSKKPTGVAPPFCEVRGSLFYLDTWHLAKLGNSGWPTVDEEKNFCDWKENIVAEFPFRLCTFDRAVDTQISAYIHRDGWWNANKRNILEKLLPRVNEVMDLPERTLMIDIGANIGFFTLLAGSRGYDTIAIEPSKEAVIRLLYSLRANGILSAGSGRDVGVNSGHTRMPVSYVFQNAASDAYNSVTLKYVPENPGASWVAKEGAGVAVTTGAGA